MKGELTLVVESSPTHIAWNMQHRLLNLAILQLSESRLVVKKDQEIRGSCIKCRC